MRIIPIYFLLIMLCWVNTSAAQSKQKTKADTLAQIKTGDANETILKYEEFLEKEREADRAYTMEYYDMILKVLGAVVFVGTGIFAWLNWKTKEDIKKQVNEQFKDRIQGIIDEKLTQIDEIIKNGKEKSAKQFEEVNKIILELSSKSTKLGNVNQPEADTPDARKNDVTKLKNKEVLWVDDHPENNNYPRQVLGEAGIRFTLALSTDDAMAALQKKKFDLIISDMGRAGNQAAGIDLLNQLKIKGISTPVVIYASPAAINGFGQKAKDTGAIAVTTGYTGILNVVQKLLFEI